MFDFDQPSRRMYQLQSGQVQLSSGRDAIVGYLVPGDFFGEKSLLLSHRPDQIAKSLSPLNVSAFRKADLLDRLQQDRRFALRLLRNLALRLDRSELMIRDLVTERAERRLARLLLRFLPARSASGWVRLSFSPTNSELARTIGTTRWRISHFMRHFQRLGWLDRRPDLWVRCEALREFVESAAKQASTQV